MSNWSAMANVADLLATLFKPVAGVAFLLSRPILRVWRLAWLRSQTDGHVPVSSQFDGPVHLAGRVRLRMGERCRLGGGIFFETCGGQITLGSRVRINAGSVLVSYTCISIGNDCLIGEYVSIRDANHGTGPGAPMRTQAHVSAPIIIGDDVWIARGAVVLKGVIIGSGAVVAANSVVNRDVPPGAIVGGSPARVLKMRTGQLNLTP